VEVSAVSKRYAAWPLPWSSSQGYKLLLHDVLLNRDTVLGNGNVLNTDGHVSDWGEAVYAQGPAPDPCHHVFQHRASDRWYPRRLSQAGHLEHFTDRDVRR
jgi:hypothetical protein